MYTSNFLQTNFELCAVIPLGVLKKSFSIIKIFHNLPLAYNLFLDSHYLQTIVFLILLQSFCDNAHLESAGLVKAGCLPTIQCFSLSSRPHLCCFNYVQTQIMLDSSFVGRGGQ